MILSSAIANSTNFWQIKPNGTVPIFFTIFCLHANSKTEGKAANTDLEGDTEEICKSKRIEEDILVVQKKGREENGLYSNKSSTEKELEAEMHKDQCKSWEDKIYVVLEVIRKRSHSIYKYVSRLRSTISPENMASAVKSKNKI